MLYFESELLRLRSALGYETESSKRVVEVKRLMDHRFSEEHTLESLSRAALVSQFHFARRFRELYGSSPIRYLTEVRLRHSALMLKQGCSVLDACHGVGFGSPTTFSGLFKKKMGVTPSDYGRRGDKTKTGWKEPAILR